MAIKETAESILMGLPPAPWHAHGNRVMAGTRTIALVLDGPGEETLAQELARLPERIENAFATAPELSALAAEQEDELAQVRDEVEDLRTENEDLQDENEDLRQEIESLRHLLRAVGTTPAVSTAKT